jgi:hypothetical protein
MHRPHLTSKPQNTTHLLEQVLRWGLTTTLFVLLVQSSVSAAQAAARFELSPLTGQLQTAGTSVVVSVNSDGNNLKSATAVLTYDQTKVTVTSAEGSFFPEITTDSSTPGELVISGTLTIGNTTGVTGTGTLATLTLTPIASATGTVSLSFRCSDSSSDDSNLITLDDTNLLTSAAQCANNSTGSYTIATSSSGDSGGGSTGGSGDTAGTTPGSRSCNQSCTAARDCAGNLSCISGFCRNSQCSTTSNCSCAGADIAAAQGDTALPESGSINQTMLLITTGSFFMIGGVLLVINEKIRRAENSN